MMNKKLVWLVALMAILTAHVHGQNTCVGHVTFRIQVGSFRKAINAQGYLTRLGSACFNPVLEQHGCLYRVVVPVGGAEEVEAVIQRLGNAGFRNVWIRGGATVRAPDGGQGIGWVLVGSFRKLDNARSYFARLKSAGFELELELFDSPHGTVIRILIPDVRMSERLRVIQQLRNAGFNGVWMRG